MSEMLDVRALLAAGVVEGLAAVPFDLGTLSDETLADIRVAMGSVSKPELSDNVIRTDHEVPDSGGVIVRVHRPAGVSGDLPCVYWMHGGGLVLGSYLGEDARFDRWSPMFNCVGLSVEYRLAPEAQYPGPLDDCYAGLRWVHERAAELGIDRSRIGLGGSSAGAGLAAGLALLARDRADVPLAFQLLLYPMIDDRQITTSSRWQDPVCLY